MHVFLDLDGTLVDPKPGITGSAIQALHLHGLDAPHPDDLEWMIGPPLLDSFTKLGSPDPHVVLKSYREIYSAGAMFDVTVYEGVTKTLSILKETHSLYLATAKPHVFATQITAHIGLANNFISEFGPELDGTRNDKGELLAYAVEKLQIDGTKAVMVGDRGNDLKAARDNGMRFIAADWGYGVQGELDGADLRCASPSDLVWALKSLS